MAHKILIIGDDRKTRRLCNWGLASDAWQAQTANSRTGVISVLDRHAFHVACIDLQMAQDNPDAIIDVLQQRVPDLPIVALLSERDAPGMAQLRERGIVAHLISPFEVATLRDL